MALFLKDDHPNNPPNTWQVKRSGRSWALTTADGGGVLDTFARKGDAEAAKTSGRLVDLYILQ